MTDTNSGLVAASNGALRDPVTGKIVAMPKPTITRENAAELARRRHEITRQKIAKSIADRSREKHGDLVNGPSDAVALAAGELWRDIALNPDAPARERRETWQAIGKYAGMLSDLRQNDENNAQNGPDALQQTIAQAIVQAVMALRDE